MTPTSWVLLPAEVQSWLDDVNALEPREAHFSELHRVILRYARPSDRRPGGRRATLRAEPRLSEVRPHRAMRPAASLGKIALMADGVGPTAASRARRNLPWVTCLVVGILLWLGSLLITELTNDPILIPTVILLGSFVVPVTVVVFAMSRERADRLPPTVMFMGFIAGGTVGVLCSALLETYYLPHGKGTYLSVGLIEEGAKALVVLAVAHQVVERGPRDGMVLGAIVGAGFAAFETSGYALSTLLKHMDDHGIMSVANTELTRGILAPFGHILWTALVGGALFESAQRTGAFRLTSRLLWTFVGVVALHGAWDASYGAAIMVTRGLVGEGWELTWPSVANWIGTPTGSDLHVFRAVYDVILGLNALVGTLWIVHAYRTYSKRLALGVDRVAVAPPRPACGQLPIVHPLTWTAAVGAAMIGGHGRTAPRRPPRARPDRRPGRADLRPPAGRLGGRCGPGRGAAPARCRGAAVAAGRSR